MGLVRDPSIGLCSTCRWARVQRTPRSAFWRCGLAERDDRYLRYPPLPITVCPGHESGEPVFRGTPDREPPPSR